MKATVSPEMFEFFQVELRNEEAMRSEQARKGREMPPASCLGTAHDSLCQAPYDVIESWFHGDNTTENSATHQLIEFGQLLERYGDDALLEDFARG